MTNLEPALIFENKKNRKLRNLLQFVKFLIKDEAHDSRSRHSLMLHISETIGDTDTVSMEY